MSIHFSPSVTNARSIKPSLHALQRCGAAWKRGESSPIEIHGRTFDRVPGSVEMSNQVHDALRDCLLGHVEDVDTRLAEIDAMEEWLGAVARLDAAFFGSPNVNHADRPGNTQDDNGNWQVQRLAREPDTGWACGKSSPVEVGGVTYDAVVNDPPREIRQGNRILVIAGTDDSFALYHVLRRALLELRDVTDRDAVMAAGRELADHLARHAGEWPASSGWGI